jgi:hypothetical protein
MSRLFQPWWTINPVTGLVSVFDVCDAEAAVVASFSAAASLAASISRRNDEWV